MWNNSAEQQNYVSTFSHFHIFSTFSSFKSLPLILYISVIKIKSFTNLKN